MEWCGILFIASNTLTDFYNIFLNIKMDKIPLFLFYLGNLGGYTWKILAKLIRI